MIVATNYEIKTDPDGCRRILNRAAPLCPDCGAVCSGYDTRRRKMISTAGDVTIYKLRRLRCPGCGRYHVELPDIMAPRKHYERAAIDAARAGSAADVAAEDSTIRRWRK